MEIVCVDWTTQKGVWWGGKTSSFKERKLGKNQTEMSGFSLKRPRLKNKTIEYDGVKINCTVNQN